MSEWISFDIDNKYLLKDNFILFDVNGYWISSCSNTSRSSLKPIIELNLIIVV